MLGFQICSNVRGYLTYFDRQKAIEELRKEGYNHFVRFKDVQSDFALRYEKAEWVTICQIDTIY